MLAGCQAPRRWVSLQPYVKPPEEQLPGVATWFATACRQCPSGCGVVARVMNGRAVKLEGNGQHPLNRGKLCARGQAALQVLYSPDRLAGPVRQRQRGSRAFEAIDWNEGLNSLLATVGAAGGRVAILTNSTVSGHTLALFQRLAAAVDAPSPVVFDLYTAYHGYADLLDVDQSLLGARGLPAYDLGNADVVVSFGADFLGTWLSATRYGVEYGSFRSQALGKRGYLVQLEPRMTNTGAKADLWLPVTPGSQGVVARALARLIADQSLGPKEVVTRARGAAGTTTPAQAAEASGVSVADLERLARLFAEAERPVAVPGAGDAAALAAAQSLNVVAGSVGRLGGVMPPVAAPPAVVEVMPSPMGQVTDLMTRMADGDVQVLLVHGANPVYDLGAPKALMDALSKVETVVTFAPMVDETSVWADLILPDHTPLESWGYAVVAPGFGQAIVTSQQPVVTPVRDTRATADVLLALGRGLGAGTGAIMPWADEVALLQDVVGQLPRGAAYQSGSAGASWAGFRQHGGWWLGDGGTAASTAPSAATNAAAARAAAAAPAAVVPEPAGNPAEYPYELVLGMSPFLGDGRGASQPWLQGAPDPLTTIGWQTWVELHPSTAAAIGAAAGDVLRVTSPYGTLEAPLVASPSIGPGLVGVPLGQGHTDSGRYARDQGSNVMVLLPPPDQGGRPSTQRSRVRVERTGRRAAVAVFGDTLGVTEGFVNESFPGT